MSFFGLSFLKVFTEITKSVLDRKKEQARVTETRESIKLKKEKKPKKKLRC